MHQSNVNVFGTAVLEGKGVEVLGGKVRLGIVPHNIVSISVDRLLGGHFWNAAPWVVSGPFASK
jgi:hypothetical protein